MEVDQILGIVFTLLFGSFLLFALFYDAINNKH